MNKKNIKLDRKKNEDRDIKEDNNLSESSEEEDNDD